MRRTCLSLTRSLTRSALSLIALLHSGGWKTSTLNQLDFTFKGSIKFQGTGLDKWNVVRVTNNRMTDAFKSCGVTSCNKRKILDTWGLGLRSTAMGLPGTPTAGALTAVLAAMAAFTALVMMEAAAGLLATVVASYLTGGAPLNRGRSRQRLYSRRAVVVSTVLLWMAGGLGRDRRFVGATQFTDVQFKEATWGKNTRTTKHLCCPPPPFPYTHVYP